GSPPCALDGVRAWAACACLQADTAAASAACASTTVGSNVLVREGTCASSPGDHHATTVKSVTVTNTTETRRVRIDIPPIWRATEPAPAARGYSPAERGQMVAFPLKTARRPFNPLSGPS